MKPVGTCGDLWGPVGTCGDLWGPVGTCGDLWGPVGTCGDLWGPVGTCGDLWGPVGTCGDLWGPVGTCGVGGMPVVCWFLQVFQHRPKGTPTFDRRRSWQMWLPTARQSALAKRVRPGNVRWSFFGACLLAEFTGGSVSAWAQNS